jgi:hypothetical protein
MPVASTITIVAAVHLLSCGTAVQAAKPSPDDQSTEPRERLHLRMTDLSLELEGSVDQRRVTSSRIGLRDTSQKNSDVRFQETLRFTLDGDILDPRFIRFTGSFGIGLSQERYRESIDGITERNGDSGFFNEFDVSMDLFAEKPVSFSAYARKSRDRLPRRFLPSLIDDRAEAGVSMLAIGDNTRTQIGFDWLDVDRSGNRNDFDDEQLRNSRFHLDHEWTISPDQELRLFYEHQRENNEYQGSEFDFDLVRDEIRLEHELRFGDERKHRLDTYVRYNDESGDFARDEFEFAPRLTLHHHDRFQTVYRYNYYELKQGAIDLQRHRLDAEAVWRPFDDLRITGDLFWLTERIEHDEEIYEFGGSFDASYQKRFANGTFGANLAFAADRIRTVGDGGQRVVRGEVHVLESATPTFLRQLDIERASILAFNASRTRVFVPGTDYTITTVGRRTIVQRLLSGRIPTGEPVLFDYQYRIPVGNRTDTNRVDLLLEHVFDFGLTPYYNLEIRRQFAHGSSGTPGVRDNSERHRFGLRYDRQRWSASAELEHFNDTNEPYDAFHLNGRWSVWENEMHLVEAAARFSTFKYTGDIDRRDVWWVDIDLTDRMQLGRYWDATFAAAYRHEDDSIDGDTDAVDLQLGLHFVRGHLDVSVTAEYDLLSLMDNRDEGFGVWVNVRRDLTHFLTDSRKR